MPPLLIELGPDQHLKVSGTASDPESGVVDVEVTIVGGDTNVTKNTGPVDGPWMVTSYVGFIFGEEFDVTVTATATNGAGLTTQVMETVRVFEEDGD